MSKFNLANLIRTPFVTNKNILLPISSRWYCKNEDDSSKLDEALAKNQKKDVGEHVVKEESNKRLAKLNSLLKEMIEVPPQTKQPIELAKPTPKWGKYRKMVEDNKSELKKPAPESPKPNEKDIVDAAKKVAETIGGNAKETESELLKKLFGNHEGEKSDVVSSLSDIFKDMKIDRSKPSGEQRTRSEQVRQILGQTMRRQQSQQRNTRSQPVAPIKKKKITKLDVIDLYGSEPLGIFTGNVDEYSEHVVNKTWAKLSEREMKLIVTHPPSNYFQEMILWTEQGKLWKFPIDNEQGLEEEQAVSFAEHIFLDKHLEPWCPPKGPIRHFMELVCVGLSKNPYLTVSAKIDHIEWYRNYFEDKRQLLKDVGSALNEIEPKKELESK